MRKWILGAVLLLALTLAALPAAAETRVIDSLFASVDIPDTYLILTPDNAASNAEWLQAQGTTSEEAANDMIARNVLFQCWTPEGDACFELTAKQDEKALNVFDVNEQSTSVRAQPVLRKDHYGPLYVADAGKQGRAPRV